MHSFYASSDAVTLNCHLPLLCICSLVILAFDKGYHCATVVHPHFLSFILKYWQEHREGVLLMKSRLCYSQMLF